ncbi:hypothetical protein [Actinomadura verrucosospora]|uniref:hypothetical protein n=1 Tax=Actinomadura verrucosospora TaxID=46165 RepID=UPI0015677AC6|nr:hypothetical protein [Actinomadura verrucosospora]
MWVPPAVTYRAIGGPAFLLAWEQHPDRSWWARILWVELGRESCTGRHARVAGDEVAPIAGQDYRTVPRHRVTRRTRPPSDPTDPRDPYHRPNAEERQRIAFERALRRKPDPDF